MTKGSSSRAQGAGCVTARVRGSIGIRRSVEDVFDFVADQRNEPRYNPRMTESVELTEGPIGVGTRFRATINSRGAPMQVTILCTGFNRPNMVASRSTMSGAVVEGEVRFRPAPGGTSFSWDWDVAVSGPARLAGPLTGWIGRRRERAIWTGLKVLLEGTS